MQPLIDMFDENGDQELNKKEWSNWINGASILF